MARPDTVAWDQRKKRTSDSAIRPIPGAYADLVYDFGSEQPRLSLGPELGYHLLGVDGGLLVALVDDRPTAGITGRTLITFAFVHLYVRGGGGFGERSFSFIELGVLWKLPVPVLHRENRLSR